MPCPSTGTTTVSQEWTELPQLELIETMRPPIIEFEVVMLCAAGIGGKLVCTLSRWGYLLRDCLGIMQSLPSRQYSSLSGTA